MAILDKARIFLTVWARYAATLGVLVLSVACSLSDLVSHAEVPTDVRDPNVIKSPNGAMDAYRGALIRLATAVGGNWGRPQYLTYNYSVGLLTDELLAPNLSNPFPTSPAQMIDSRNTENLLNASGYTHTGNAFQNINAVRTDAQMARHALKLYAPNSPPELQGHLYAIEGFAEVLLAELYCSGIPLSTIDLMGDYTATRGFSTDEVYSHALQLLDSALHLSGDSLRFRHFAGVVRGRIFLSLGRYEDAARAVEDVSVEYQYTTLYTAARSRMILTTSGVVLADREGFNGLPFADDPRIQRPELRDSLSPLVLASGIEAKLIRAEADIHAGSSDWIRKINELRTSCESADSCPTPAPAGEGNIAGLIPLTDPNADTLIGKTLKDARVDIVVAERAYWLFLTGHRQGDLRRLVRIYGRPKETVYPIGAWGSQEISHYGDGVALPVPVDEIEANPYYRGCIHNDA